MHAALFGAWMVDDAGISLAYARNLANGHGLVSQPGVPAVEGYSDPLWVAIEAVLIAIGALEVPWTPKLLGATFAMLSLVLLYATFRDLAGGRRSVGFATLACLASSTAFVAWTVSGLENGLYVFWIASMLALAVRARDPARALPPVRFAGLALAAALTRPEGLAYAAFFPLAVAVRGSAEGWRTDEMRRRVAIYAAAFGAVASSLVALRLWYFHALWPNTYFAKGGPTLQNLVEPGKLASLFDRAAGGGGIGWPLTLACANLYLLRRGWMDWRHALSLFVLCLGAALFLMLPRDGFSEFRFGAAFFAIFYGHALVTTVLVWMRAPISRAMREAAWSMATIALVLLVVLLDRPFALRFVAAPPVPFQMVQAEYSRRFEGYAASLGIREASILIPDVGAMLWFSKFRVFDLGMLTDRTIARTLAKDPRAFLDYVFEETRPTFIHTHDLWTCLARFDTDPRFRRDYVPLREWEGDAWVYESTGRRMLRSGDYVRRDALAFPMPGPR